MRRPSIPKPKRSLPKSKRAPAAPVPTGPGARLVPVEPPKPRRERPPLRIILLGVLAIVALVLLVRACGSDDEKEVRETVERFGTATRDKDYQELCDELLSLAVVEQLRAAGQPCEVALRIGLGERQNPTIEVRSVEVDGDEALAEVDTRAAGEQPSRDKIRLLREDDGWRISSLANEAPSDSTP